jgi:hypothetical protein
VALRHQRVARVIHLLPPARAVRAVALQARRRAARADPPHLRLVLRAPARVARAKHLRVPPARVARVNANLVAPRAARVKPPRRAPNLAMAMNKAPASQACEVFC